MNDISSCMRLDHENTQRMLLKFVDDVKGGKVEIRTMYMISRRVERHIFLEGYVVFVYFQKFTGLGYDDGIVHVMVRDHSVVRKLLKVTEESCMLKQLQKALYYANNLRRKLDSHENRLVTSIYTIAEKAAKQQEWSAAVRASIKQPRGLDVVSSGWRWNQTLTSR